jgi:hypothetical protein
LLLQCLVQRFDGKVTKESSSNQRSKSKKLNVLQIIVPNGVDGLGFIHYLTSSLSGKPLFGCILAIKEMMPLIESQSQKHCRANSKAFA